jgi:hypothetical protein
MQCNVRANWLCFNTGNNRENQESLIGCGMRDDGGISLLMSDAADSVEIWQVERLA